MDTPNNPIVEVQVPVTKELSVLPEVPQRPARKRGALSNQERYYIEQNCQTLSLQTMCDVLNRSKDPVRRYIKDKGLIHVEKRADAAQEDLELRKKLRGKFYWSEVLQQFTDEEIVLFENMWVALMRQLKEDVLASEELQIKQLITTEILMDRSMRNRMSAIRDINRFQKKLEAEYDKKQEEQDFQLISSLEGQKGLAISAQTAHSTEHQKLAGDLKSLRNELKTSRAERIKKIEDSKASWVGLIKALEDEDLREREGYELGLFKKAVEKTKKKYTELHPYIDGTVDSPLLLPETIESEDNDEEHDEDDPEDQDD
jgi:hypothetical protein